LAFIFTAKEKLEYTEDGCAFLRISGLDIRLSKDLIIERMDFFSPDWKEERKTIVFPVISDPKYMGPFGLKVMTQVVLCEKEIRPGSICKDISAILKFNLTPLFLSKILRSMHTSSGLICRDQSSILKLRLASIFLSKK
jgi:hypothetical protein